MSAMRSMPADAGLLSLQQEALQRVRQMQQRARFAVEGGPGGNTPPPSAQAAPASAPFSQQGGPSQTPGAAPPNPSMPGGDAQRSGPRQGFSASRSSSPCGAETAASLRRREYPLPAVRRRHAAAVPRAGSGKPARPRESRAGKQDSST